MSQAIETIVLHNACNLLNAAFYWTSKAWARDENGVPCRPLSRRARQWCAWSAIYKCAFDLVGQKQAAREIADRISKELVPCVGGIISVNEREGYEGVIAILSRGVSFRPT